MRSIIRDFVEHAIPRESFTYAPLGMRPSQRSQTTHAEDPRVLHTPDQRNC